jgi:plasmid replication initiation protein
VLAGSSIGASRGSNPIARVSSISSGESSISSGDYHQFVLAGSNPIAREKRQSFEVSFRLLEYALAHDPVPIAGSNPIARVSSISSGESSISSGDYHQFVLAGSNPIAREKRQSFEVSFRLLKYALAHDPVPIAREKRN